MKALKAAYNKSGDKAKALKMARDARDRRLSFLDGIVCAKINLQLESIDIFELPDLPSVRKTEAEKQAAATAQATEKETEEAVDSILVDNEKIANPSLSGESSGFKTAADGSCTWETPSGPITIQPVRPLIQFFNLQQSLCFEWVSDAFYSFSWQSLSLLTFWAETL